MPFSVTTWEGRQVLQLAGAVTIRDGPELAARLAAELEEGARVEVDTGGLEDIDTCILQLLYSLRQTVPELFFDHPSEVFLRAVDRCGLRRDLLGGREGL
jgi:anti-anti-sigma regulatory factor